MNQAKINKFVEERNRVLLSLNKEKILFYMRKYNIQPYTKETLDVPLEVRERIFWGGVHYAITQIASATNEQKEASISWLAANGFEIPDKVEFQNEEESK